MPLDWLVELDQLLQRFPDAGIHSDIGCMTLDEVWGLLLLLQRRAEEC
jgi:hypothetical protein